MTNIRQIMEEPGGSFVDGGIIGDPAWQPEKAGLDLSGAQVATVATCFEMGLETQVLGDELERQKLCPEDLLQIMKRKCQQASPEFV